MQRLPSANQKSCLRGTSAAANEAAHRKRPGESSENLALPHDKSQTVSVDRHDGSNAKKPGTPDLSRIPGAVEHTGFEPVTSTMRM